MDVINKIIENFKDISKIPRCSYNWEKILSFFENWAKQKLYDYKIDSWKNIIIYVPATYRREKEKTVILQWHMDMVCVKSEDSKHDFKKDSIEIIEKDWFLRANNTTLWADNGVGLAIIMLLTEIDSHSNLEVLITSDEEVWLIWASNLDKNNLKWKYLINVDNETEWEIIISSAWWVKFEIKSDVETEKSKFQIYDLNIFGMKWGHSWLEINKKRWNCIFEFIRFLDNLKGDFEIVSIKSWIADNVIPSELKSKIWIDNISYFKEKLKEFQTYIKHNFDASDFSFSIEKSIWESEVCDRKFIKKLFKKIIYLWDWVIKMSENIDNLVQTSSNLWIIDLNNSNLTLIYSIRSSNKQDMEKLVLDFESIFWDFNLKMYAFYPGWEWSKNDYLSKVVKKSFDDIFSSKSKFMAVHAWLECWSIIEKLWWYIQAISVWPNIKGAHSIKETCEIDSIEKTYLALEKVLTDFKF